MSERFLAGVEQIRDFLPHKFPFLFIDRVIEIQFSGKVGDLSGESNLGTRVLALKNVTYNEPFMPGHFPSRSIMPGVLTLEALAQTACMSPYPHFASKPQEFAQNYQCILAGFDRVRFRRPVVPGDSLILQTTASRIRGTIWFFTGEAKVDGQLVTEAEFMANFIGVGDKA